MKPNLRILVCDTIDKQGVKKLLNAGFTVDVKPDITPADLKKTIHKYDVVVVRGRTQVTRDIINAGTRLKAVGRAGSGLDNIDVAAAKKRGVKVLNTPDAPAQAAAELTLGLFLSLARSIPRADQAMKDGKWVKKGLIGWELRGKTLGVIGLGNVGERVARLARAFDMKILIHKRTPPDTALLEALQAEFVSLNELLKRSDIVTIHIPYSPRMRHMIGENEIALMKKSACLINTSRGALVDEKALAKALQSRHLKGVALDVYEAEPPHDWTLVKLPSVISTPHIGAQTEEAQKMASSSLAEKIISAFS